MILWGDIRQFPLLAVLQFLGGQQRTGILEIQDFEEVGTIYVGRGRIDAVSAREWDEALGRRLVKAAALTEKELKECLIKGGDGETDNGPVGPVTPTLLLQRARGDLRTLREIVDNHVGDVVMQLMFWSSGTFRFSLPAKSLAFTVVPFRGMEELLLDAIRRVDEGERPWREKVPAEVDLCRACTLNCSPEMKSRYLKADVCLWRTLPSVLRESVYQSERSRGPSEYEDDYYEDLPFL